MEPESLLPFSQYPSTAFSLRTEDREKGDLGAVGPYSGVLEAAVIWYKKFHVI